ncbi:PREDICTED: FAD synthase-like [Ceratosolen solmsi marchali]|uniref:FAD synthase n=1 Tax=Ceratosolen solmsi marchali TaxID=326594 RepID=A0AAJ6YEQ7_9HYME|nr:PREDICTED: FAD synthase-like [Ceratosolen solmsi marchali]
MADEQIASLIIIGDEILRGRVQDANTIYLAKNLEAKGIKIQKVVIIPDEIDIISKEVAEASKKYTIVFTSGGVGPTHDDLTYQGVAKGLGLALKENKILLNKLSLLFPNKPESRRLALVPNPCELIDIASNDSDAGYVLVKARNVFVLPGSPRYFRRAAEAALATLESGGQLYTESLEIELDEFALAEPLETEARRWRDTVTIGSYPQRHGPRPRTRLDFVARCPEALAQAKASVIEALPEEARPGPTVHLRAALDVLEQCYAKYKANEVFLSFNGGKDCTVVLHLVITFARLRGYDPPLCLYVTGDAFPEVDEFVRNTANNYRLKMVRKSGSIKQALAALLEEYPKLAACLLGTRKADPGAQCLESFAPTDPGWPEIMRVSPIIDWNYKQVWDYLLRNNVSYCSLYDEGYTSLGVRETTTRNPLLKHPSEPNKYLPAHTLVDDSTERQGRE